MITLQTLQGTGIVRVQSSPPGSTLIFDGEEYGNAPVTITNVEEGEHEYVLKADGFEDYKGNAVVTAGELCCVDVAMDTGEETSQCTPAARTPCAANQTGTSGVPGIGPGYLVIPERAVIYVLGGILAGIIIWAILSRSKK